MENTTFLAVIYHSCFSTTRLIVLDVAVVELIWLLDKNSKLNVLNEHFQANVRGNVFPRCMKHVLLLTFFMSKSLMVQSSSGISEVIVTVMFSKRLVPGSQYCSHFTWKERRSLGKYSEFI